MANGSVGPNSISFASSLTSGGPATLLLTGGELAISDELTIVGPGDRFPHDSRVRSRRGSRRRRLRILYIDDGASTLAAVTISGLTFTGGDTGARRGGGAIVTRENLHVAECVIRDNQARINSNLAGGSGGGIWSARAYS